MFPFSSEDICLNNRFDIFQSVSVARENISNFQDSHGILPEFSWDSRCDRAPEHGLGSIEITDLWPEFWFPPRKLSAPKDTQNCAIIYSPIPEPVT